MKWHKQMQWVIISTSLWVTMAACAHPWEHLVQYPLSAKFVNYLNTHYAEATLMRGHQDFIYLKLLNQNKQTLYQRFLKYLEQNNIHEHTLTDNEQGLHVTLSEDKMLSHAQNQQFYHLKQYYTHRPIHLTYKPILFCFLKKDYEMYKLFCGVKLKLSHQLDRRLLKPIINKLEVGNLHLTISEYNPYKYHHKYYQAHPMVR